MYWLTVLGIIQCLSMTLYNYYFTDGGECGPCDISDTRGTFWGMSCFTVATTVCVRGKGLVDM
jgi:hypothetical protein